MQISQRCALESSRPRRSLRRRGALVLELLLTLPILFTVLLALFEFSLLFMARGTMTHASHVGARAAATPLATEDEVVRAVMHVLPSRLHDDVTLDVTLGERTGDAVVVSISAPMDSASPDLLWYAGFSLEDRLLLAETRLIKE